MKQNVTTPRWLFYLLGCILLAAMAGGIFDFIHRWHSRGDSFAQAEGNLLTFIAAGFFVMVTLIYIAYTRRSLETAEAAIQLQREQWEHIVKVRPRIRLIEGINGHLWYIEKSEMSQVEEIGRFPEVGCVVWNYGQQSLLEDIIVSREDRVEFVEDSCRMIKPNTEETFDISRAIGILLAPPASEGRNVLQNLPDANTKLKLIVCYTDWLHERKKSDPLKFELEFTQTATKEEMFKIKICD